MNELVAVYGTLRKGFSNYDWYIKPFLGSSVEFVGKGRTKKKYAMYASGIPFVVGDEKVSNIVVEVYRIKDKLVLKDIDELEGHPEWYKRRKVDIVLDNGQIVKAWLYFYTPIESMPIELRRNNYVLVKSGDYVDYAKGRWYYE